MTGPRCMFCGREMEKAEGPPTGPATWRCSCGMWRDIDPRAGQLYGHLWVDGDGRAWQSPPGSGTLLVVAWVGCE